MRRLAREHDACIRSCIITEIVSASTARQPMKGLKEETVR
jgi:hypothetical protein